MSSHSTRGSTRCSRERNSRLALNSSQYGGHGRALAMFPGSCVPRGCLLKLSISCLRGRISLPTFPGCAARFPRGGGARICWRFLCLEYGGGQGRAMFHHDGRRRARRVLAKTPGLVDPRRHYLPTYDDDAVSRPGATATPSRGGRGNQSAQAWGGRRSGRRRRRVPRECTCSCCGLREAACRDSTSRASRGGIFPAGR